MRNLIYDPSNRAYNQLKGSNPGKFQFQFLITHYYWKEENYYKEYIAQFSGIAVIFDKSVFHKKIWKPTFVTLKKEQAVPWLPYHHGAVNKYWY